MCDGLTSKLNVSMFIVPLLKTAFIVIRNIMRT